MHNMRIDLYILAVIDIGLRIIRNSDKFVISKPHLWNTGI